MYYGISGWDNPVLYKGIIESLWDISRQMLGSLLVAYMWANVENLLLEFKFVIETGILQLNWL